MNSAMVEIVHFSNAGFVSSIRVKNNDGVRYSA